MHRLRLAALAGAVSLLAAIAPAGAGTDTTTSSVVFTGIRPGSMIIFSWERINALKVAPRYCTAGFVYQTSAGAFDPAQQLYLGTAAHCVTLGQTVEALVVPPGQGTYQTVEIGTVVVHDTTSDVAMIAIDPALSSWVSPSTAHVGGPTGAHPSGTMVPVTMTGHGRVGGTGGTTRPGRLTLYNAFNPAFVATVHVSSGDSGAPVLTAGGLAVGQVESGETGYLGKVGVEHPGIVFADDTAHGPTIATIVGVGGFPLATCPSRTPWPAPGCAPV